MRVGTLVKWSFIISFIITLFGAYLKITHSTGAYPLLIIGLASALVFIVSAIYEVRTSSRIKHNEKTMWTIALIFMGGFAGFVYFFIGRKRIAISN